MKKHPIDGARDRARALRHEMTEAERSLWRILRSRQIERHAFRRQVPFGRYIADFVCHQARLVIEVDGGQHEPSSLRGAERSRFLKSQGYRVLRFWNHEILENPDGVHAMIVEHLRHHPHPTLPHRGPIEGEGPIPRASRALGFPTEFERVADRFPHRISIHPDKD